MIQLNDIWDYLPHGLRVVIIFNSEVREVIRWENDNLLKISAKSYPFSDIYKMDELKPLLLPPEAMSEELKDELEKVLCGCVGAITLEALDIYHANMIDYTNLIKRGDALDMREYIK